METKLARIAEAARMRPDEKFTSLAHLINEETIKECHREMEKKKAAGVDEVTKEEYELNLESRCAPAWRTLRPLVPDGYFNRIRSSRRLILECAQNIELFYLLNRLAQDFRTIADFRKNNAKALKQVFKAFVGCVPNFV